MSDDDTIVALATPPGRGALALLRISGPRAAGCIPAITSRTGLPPRQACLCALRGGDGREIDRGVLVFYEAPASATGEDVLEITCHGAPAVVRQLLLRLRELGIRGAQPGEFSRRAYVAGKMDLAQAQAVADLIAATTDRAARCAARVLEGEVSRELRALCAEIEELVVPLEGYLDFPDDEIGSPDQAMRDIRIASVRDRLDTLLARARQGRTVHSGIRMALLGPPNVGKSSLLNRCTGTDTAIVTDEPGTTRDVLEAPLQVAGIPVLLQDTAGIRETGQKAESEGVRRSWRAVDEADLVLQMFDAAAGWSPADEAIARRLEDRTCLVLANKCDLLGEGQAPRGGPADALAISARTAAGMDELFERITDMLHLDAALEEDEFMAHGRQVEALERARECVARACGVGACELVAEELRAARSALGEMVGEFTSEDLLGEIFSRFCIGK